MIRQFILIASLLMATISTHAAADVDSSEAAANKVHAAVMLLDNDEYGADRTDGFYHLVVGVLQRYLKREDILVSNAILKAEDQPRTLMGADQLAEVVKKLDIDSLDTLVMLDAITLPHNPQVDQHLELQLQWQTYDIRQQVIIGAHSISTRLPLDENCDQRCLMKELGDQYLGLTREVAKQAIADIEQHYATTQSGILLSQI